MAPAVAHRFISKFATRTADGLGDVLARGPLAARTVLLARDAATTTAIVHSGVTSAQNINNKGMFALFGILGAAICVGIIWFFFWAKNGGFYFKENDWDDYKSTVLRRRGPNGTILSNATVSTKLGGGSVYKDVADYTEDNRTVVSGTTALTEVTGITAGVSDIVGRENHRKKREQRARERERNKERERERRREEKSREKSREKPREKSREKSRDTSSRKKERSRRQVNEEGVLVDEDAEAEAQAYLQDYRQERPARVGGINRASDSSAWDGSTNAGSSTAPTESTESTVTSELISHREVTPTNTPTKKTPRNNATGGIRKVYSTADRNAHRENERIRAEAKRLQERNREARASSRRRDFSWQYGEDQSTPLRQIEEATSSVSEGSRSYTQGAITDITEESDLGTKAYRHVIPGLSSVDSAAEDANDLDHERDRDRKRYEEKRRLRRQKSGYQRG